MSLLVITLKGSNRRTGAMDRDRISVADLVIFAWGKCAMMEILQELTCMIVVCIVEKGEGQRGHVSLELICKSTDT